MWGNVLPLLFSEVFHDFLVGPLMALVVYFCGDFQQKKFSAIFSTMVCLFLAEFFLTSVFGNALLCASTYNSADS